LERKGWIEAEWGLSENHRKAKFYRLTDEGRAALQAEVSSWRTYVEAVSKVLETA
jgi:DNA-binding PadR family transcriptional regulator